ncbi:DUF4382 domain-containing protein [Halosolutus halophilus]|uniref:DUF4382 domain-containing protein n=1 Tax=Halosolutus halophilus TaxID=1552990 RepID=UPI002234F2B2|nr:DUF4382 domain-containing protein [Halosolutus halophilus]
MPEKQSSHDRSRNDDRFKSIVGRRAFIAAGSGVSATLLAGCTADSTPADDENTEGSTDDADTESGNFRLLISDMPADIGDFDRLDVTFDRARIFDGGNEEADDEDESDDDKEAADEEEQADDGDGADDPDDDEEDEEESEKEDDEENENVERKRGFYILDLDGATVDLTQVVGDKATNVFEGGLSEGTYQKIELYVSDVEGIVDGEAVEVNVPNEKLQINKSFEIGGDDSVEFVFDINVVKRGPDNGYNLKPVISKSGVNGKDIDVQEVKDDADKGDEKKKKGAGDEDGAAETEENGTDEDDDGADN